MWTPYRKQHFLFYPLKLLGPQQQIHGHWVTYCLWHLLIWTATRHSQAYCCSAPNLQEEQMMPLPSAWQLFVQYCCPKAGRLEITVRGIWPFKDTWLQDNNLEILPLSRTYKNHCYWTAYSGDLSHFCSLQFFRFFLFISHSSLNHL